MNILLDTHVMLWALSAPEKISQKALKEINSPNNVIYVSPVSVWELSIKQSLAKNSKELEGFFKVDVEIMLKDQGIEELPLTIKHSLRIRELPWLHKDPFDRILIAQAIEESLTMVTRDSMILQYDKVKTLQA